MNHVTLDDTAPSDGRSTRWNKHREERRRELLRAVRAVVHDNGPEVSMDTIAQQTGTSKTVYYRYFGDRNGLQDAVGEWAMNVIAKRLSDAFEGPERRQDRMRAMILAYAELGARSPAVYAFASGSAVIGGGQIRPGTFYDGVAELLLEAADLEETPSAIGRQWAAGAMGFVRGCVDAWLPGASESEPRRQAEAEELAERIAAWLWTTTEPLREGRLDDEEDI